MTKTTLETLFKEITKWSKIYEFSFEFWGDRGNNYFITKGDIRMNDSGGFETPQKAIEAALEWVNKQNPKGYKEPKEKVNYCMRCGCRIAPGNDLCGECA